MELGESTELARLEKIQPEFSTSFHCQSWHLEESLVDAMESGWEKAGEVFLK